MGLKNRDKLLADVTRQLNSFANNRVYAIEVTFHVPTGESYTFGLVSALSAIANGLYWDERGNWSEAERATVGTI